MPMLNKDAAMRRVMEVAQAQGPSAARSLIKEYGRNYTPEEVQMAYQEVQRYEMGGPVYRQAGGPADVGPEMGEPFIEGATGAQGPAVPPVAAPGAPAGGPMIPDTPGAMVAPTPSVSPPAPAPAPRAPAARKSFLERVGDAEDFLKDRKPSAPAMPMMMSGVANEPMVDETVHPGQPVGEDTIPAWLTPGEYVVNAEAMADPANAAMVDAINEEGRQVQAMKRGGLAARPMMMFQGGDVNSELMQLRAIFENDGGKVGYYQEGGEAAPSWYAQNREGLGRVGAALVNIGQRDFKGASSALAGPSAEAKDATVGTKTWMDQDTKLKYKEVTRAGRTQYIGVHDGKALTDTAAISRLVLVGTEGSGAAEPEAPEKLLQKGVSDRFMNALGDAKEELLKGGADIVDLINRRSVTATEYAKIAVAAKAAGGSDEIFSVLNTVLGKAIVQSQPRANIVAFHNFLHSVSQFEVIASQASGETRLTDEDAKRYLKAIVDPEATPESILTQLGRAYFDVMKESERTALWQEWAATAPGTQRTEYYFNQNVWNQKAAELDGRRQEIIADFVGDGWTPSGDDTLALGKPGERGGEVVARHTIGGKEFTFVNVDDVPEDVKADIQGKPGVPFLGDDGFVYYFEAPIVSKAEGESDGFLGSLVSGAQNLVAGEGTYFKSQETYDG